MVMWKLTRNISLCLPEELLVEMDDAAKRSFMSRSEYIRQVINRHVVELRKSPYYQTPQVELWRFADTDDS